MANRTRVYGILGLVCVGVLVTSPTVFAADPPPDAIWGDLGPITITEILVYDVDMTPAPNDYIPINHTRFLKATAIDKDCWRINEEVEEGEEVWYPYYDDVTSGTAEGNHHMWWTASVGELSAAYGPTATYTAPGYSLFRFLDSDISVVDVDVYAVDYNIGAGEQGKPNNAPGFPDEAPGHASIVLTIWQVTVSVQQSETTSGNYDGPAVGASHGGTHLGWVAHGTPAGATGYHGNTQIKGTIPQGPGILIYEWHQEAKGEQFNKEGPKAWWPHKDNSKSWKFDFGPTYPYADADPRSPNGSSNNVHEIFAMDAPGIQRGVNNDEEIVSKNATGLDYHFDFKTWVEHEGNVISNYCEWQVKFTLGVQGGKWYVVDIDEDDDNKHQHVRTP